MTLLPSIGPCLPSICRPESLTGWLCIHPFIHRHMRTSTGTRCAMKSQSSYTFVSFLGVHFSIASVAVIPRRHRLGELVGYFPDHHTSCLLRRVSVIFLACLAACSSASQSAKQAGSQPATRSRPSQRRSFLEFQDFFSQQRQRQRKSSRDRPTSIFSLVPRRGVAFGPLRLSPSLVGW